MDSSAARGNGQGWQVWDWGEDCTWDENLIQSFNRFFEDVDCIMLGRNIIEGGYLDHRTEMAKLYPDQRGAEFAGGETAYVPGTVNELTEETDPIQREFFDFYRTSRGAYASPGETRSPAA
jgi:hypothetical protein